MCRSAAIELFDNIVVGLYCERYHEARYFPKRLLQVAEQRHIRGSYPQLSDMPLSTLLGGSISFDDLMNPKPKPGHSVAVEQKRSRLMKIPLELRQKIYRLVLLPADAPLNKKKDVQRGALMASPRTASISCKPHRETAKGDAAA